MQIPPDIERTECACASCTAGCKTMPGSLIPGDLESISALSGEGSEAWVGEHFLASEGAKVAGIVHGQRVIVNVPTLVPAQKEDGSCIFLENDRCTIHSAAPFGCAYHDTHLGLTDADKRSLFAVKSQMAAHADRAGLEGQVYAGAIAFLQDEGKVALPVIERKMAFQREIEKVEG